MCGRARGVYSGGEGTGLLSSQIEGLSCGREARFILHDSGGQDTAQWGRSRLSIRIAVCWSHMSLKVINHLQGLLSGSQVPRLLCKGLGFSTLVCENKLFTVFITDGQACGALGLTIWVQTESVALAVTPRCTHASLWCCFGPRDPHKSYPVFPGNPWGSLVGGREHT